MADGSVGAVIDEAKVESERWARWFSSAQAGNNAELQRLLASRRPEDWKGHRYEWIALKNDEERTAFHIAAENGHLETIQLLVLQGADVHDTDTARETALHAAAENNHVRVMEWVVSRGVRIDAVSTAGATALFRAACRGHVDAVRYLVASRADVSLADRDQCTALHVASRDDELQIAAHLLSGGASVHSSDRMGATPVTHAREDMTRLFWFHSARHNDVAGLRRLLARQIGATGDEGCGARQRLTRCICICILPICICILPMCAYACLP